MCLLFLVNSVARRDFVGKTNAQHIFTTATTGPVVMQDVVGMTGVCPCTGSWFGAPMAGHTPAKKQGVVG